MKNSFRIILLALLITVLSCNTKAETKTTEIQEEQEMTIVKSKPTQAELLVRETIAAHGGERYAFAHYGFTFRNKTYTFKNDLHNYRYTRKSIKESDTVLDVLENGRLIRTINGKSVALSEKDDAKYTEALNSVIYFATLPSKLNDKAVNKAYKGTATINGQQYELLAVSFDKDGGGKDYDDRFLYWINTDTKLVDYLAYSYSTNDGGVRFRRAFNQRKVAGIHFQDYINYEVAIGTPLKDIPKLYEEGRLKELSKILTENIYTIE